MYVLLYLHHDITGIHENWKAMRHSIELCLLQGRIGTFQKFSALKFQNNRRTNKIKTICPLILDLRVIKKEHGPPFEYCVIPFTQGCFVPSQVQIGPVILGNKISNNYNFFALLFLLGKLCGPSYKQLRSPKIFSDKNQIYCFRSVHKMGLVILKAVQCI